MKTRAFGTGKGGEAATLYTFENALGMVMEVTDFGATLYSLKVPAKRGQMPDVVLGYDSPQGYMRPQVTCFGATIGRNGNRIGGAAFELNGVTYHLDKTNGEDNLHSGRDFYHHRIWKVSGTTEHGITFSLHSPDGDQGYPGNFDVDVTYTLTDDGAVMIEYFGIPDRDTIVNMTNHSYFNLNGHDSGDILGHRLWIDADAFVATDAGQIPTGEIVPVEATPMDFRVKKTVGRDINSDFEQIRLGKGYDHNWCLNNDGAFKKVALLSSGKSGIEMEVYTDRPGLQIYTGNYLDDEPGKGGAVYKYRQGICFETQGYPDAVHHANFPSVIVKAGDIYRTKTAYKFSTESMRRARV